MIHGQKMILEILVVVLQNDLNNANAVFDQSVYNGQLGQRYGLEPQTSQKNGWFKIDERKGTFNFTSNLA